MNNLIIEIKLLAKKFGIKSHGGQKAIMDFANAIMDIEREACKLNVYDATDWAHESGDFVLKEAIVKWIDERGKEVNAKLESLH